MLNGRPPKPPVLAALSGSKRRKGQGITVPSVAPTAPDWLSSDTKEEWIRLCALLSTMRVVSEVDEVALAQLADYMVRYKQAAAQVSKLGLVLPVKNDVGEIVSFRRNPFVTMHMEYGLLVQRLLAQFGMTPSARARLINGEQQEDEAIFSRIASTQIGSR